MDKKLTVEQWKQQPEGTKVKDVFLAGDGEELSTRGGTDFIKLPLEDPSGQAAGRIWEESDCPVPRDSFVYVVGETNFYNGDFQITIDSIQEVGREKINVSDFRSEPSSTDQERFQQLVKLINDEVQHPQLMSLSKKVLRDTQEDLLTIPAAKKNHHEESGGLLRHKLSMVQLAPILADHYDVDKDIVIVGCLFHDIGKVETFDPIFRRTEDEDRIGHITRGVEILNEAADTVQLQDDKREHIKHIILSHHLKNEWGSPVEPEDEEAYLVHLIDQMDSTMDGAES